MTTSARFRKAQPLPRSFAELVALLPPMAIRDNAHNDNTIEMIDRLMQIDHLSAGQSQYLETLVELVEVYESKRHAASFSGIAAIKVLQHVITESGMSGSDLARLLGFHPTMGSKILNGERRLTWANAKLLGARFNVAPSLFMD